ncbi:MAG: insulinase family protein [Acidiferrobacterales bacterium]|nr:insulinase family protein [Acidiferrobacterales bacterium]
MKLSPVFLRLVLFIAVFPLAVHAEFRKSPNDHREYRPIELDNRLQVLLISDSETDESAAALAVQVGGQDDPEGREGMAHYLEHMLFLGTEKYPELDGYRKFIEQHGGMTNAYTAIDITNYNFSIKPEFFAPALDRFAQFFISPLFPEEQLGRERAVVDAEFEMRTQRDSVRRWAALTANFNPEHPSWGFFTGTAETLQGDLGPELIDFYNRRYSANLMNLVVLGREPLDELEDLVVSMFSDVRDTDAEALHASQPLFEPDVLPALLQIKTLKNNPSLDFMFPVPSLEPHWRESPESYIAHLLGHESAGSLLSQLKDQGWADGLFASASDIGLTTHAISVRISLTPDGYKNWEKVGAYVFQYVREVRLRGINEWRFREIQTSNEISFRFSEVDSPRDFVTSLASRLHKYPPNEILPAFYLVERFAPDLIVDVLDRMTPQNVLVVLSSDDAHTDQATPYVGTEFSFAGLQRELVESWNGDIADSADWLPTRNRFLPENLDLKIAENQEMPEKILEQSGFELWHQTDTSFDVPRASFFVTFRTPLTKRSVEDSILMSLFVSAINEQLTEFTYAAAIAGLDYSLYTHQRGFSIRISGYDDKQSDLLAEIVRVVRNPEFDPEVFENHRTTMIRDIENSRRDSAYRRAISEFYSYIVEPSWTDEQELAVLNRVTLDDLQTFSNSVLDRIDLVALSHGNVLSETAEQMGRIITSEVLDGAQVTKVDKSRILKMPSDGGPYIHQFQIENSDSAIIVYLQGSDRSVHEVANFMLLGSVIQTPFFSQLRTIQQLGYVVFSDVVPVGEVPGLIFTIQSPDNTPQQMEAAISSFLAQFDSRVTDLSQEEFEAYRTGVIRRVEAKDTTLSERSLRYWHALDRKDFDFNHDQELVAALENLKRQEFEQFVRETLIDQIERRLIVMAYGEKLDVPSESTLAEGELITDRIAFKDNAGYFPQP